MATTNENTAVTVDVLSNDSDVEDANTALSVTYVTDPGNGQVVLNPDNTITYTPYPGWSGTDWFYYDLVDTGGEYGYAEVTITVAGGGGAPDLRCFVRNHW